MRNETIWKNLARPFTFALAVLGLAAGCDPPPEGGDVAATDQALNGSLLTKSLLTRKNLTTTTNEIERRNDTVFYYGQVGVAADGSLGQGAVDPTLSTLTKFKSWYGF